MEQQSVLQSWFLIYPFQFFLLFNLFNILFNLLLNLLLNLVQSSRTADDELPVRSSSAPTVSSLIEYALSNTKQWGTTGNLKENVSTRIKKKMGVRFDSTLRVVLIPSRKDYDVSHLSDALWWNEGMLTYLILRSYVSLFYVLFVFYFSFLRCISRNFF